MGITVSDEVRDFILAQKHDYRICTACMGPALVSTDVKSPKASDLKIPVGEYTLYISRVQAPYVGTVTMDMLYSEDEIDSCPAFYGRYRSAYPDGLRCHVLGHGVEVASYDVPQGLLGLSRHDDLLRERGATDRGEVGDLVRPDLLRDRLDLELVVTYQRPQDQEIRAYVLGVDVIEGLRCHLAQGIAHDDRLGADGAAEPRRGPLHRMLAEDALVRMVGTLHDGLLRYAVGRSIERDLLSRRLPELFRQFPDVPDLTVVGERTVVHVQQDYLGAGLRHKVRGHRGIDPAGDETYGLHVFILL